MDAYHQRFDSIAARAPRTGDEIGLCIQTMKSVVKNVGTKGFLVFIDGLHKSVTYQKQSLEFLQQMQNFQERASHEGVPLGILIAGSLGWEGEFTANPSLSGSFYGVERIPALSEESAVEAVVRRIHSYVPPGSPRPSIVKDRLREAFRILSSRLLRPPVFRDYLDHVRARFVARQYEDLGLSISLHVETLDLVQQEFMKSKLGPGYARLTDPKAHKVAFRRGLRYILPQILLRGGISERAPVFQLNKGVFSLLRREGFIVPKRGQGGTLLFWHISADLVVILQQLHDTYRIRPEDALDAMFADPIESRPAEAETIYSTVKTQMHKMVATWRSTIPEVANLVELSATQLSQVEKSAESPETLSSAETLDSLKVSLSGIVRAILFVLGNKDSMTRLDYPAFLSSWCAPENVDDYTELLERTRPLPSNTTETYGILHKHAQLVSDACSLLTDIVRGEGICRLTGRALTIHELESLHEARILFLGQNYDGCVDKIAETLDSKIKDVAYSVIRASFGAKAVSVLPQDIRDKLKQSPRGHPRVKRGPEENFFFAISRSEYAKVLFLGVTKKVLFGSARPAEAADDLKAAIELLFSLEDRVAHRDRPSFFLRHSTEIADALKAAPRVIDSLNRSIMFLMRSPDFGLKQVDGNAVEMRFGDDQNCYFAHRIEATRVETIVFDLLSCLDSGPVVIPPVEKLMASCRAEPEVVLGMLRGCGDQGLAAVAITEEPMGIEVSLTEKGRQRLAAIRKSRNSGSTESGDPPT